MVREVSGLQGCMVVVKFGIINGGHPFLVGFIEPPHVQKKNPAMRHFDKYLIYRP